MPIMTKYGIIQKTINIIMWNPHMTLNTMVYSYFSFEDDLAEIHYRFCRSGNISVCMCTQQETPKVRIQYKKSNPQWISIPHNFQFALKVTLRDTDLILATWTTTTSHQHIKICIGRFIHLILVMCSMDHFLAYNYLAKHN